MNAIIKQFYLKITNITKIYKNYKLLNLYNIYNYIIIKVTY